MAILGDIREMGEVAESTGNLDGFVRSQLAEEQIEFAAGSRVCLMFEGGAEAADPLDRFEGLNAFLIADRVTQKRGEEMNILKKKPLHIRQVAEAGVERINHRNSLGERRRHRLDKTKQKRDRSRKCLLSSWRQADLPAHRSQVPILRRRTATPRCKALAPHIEIDSLTVELYTAAHMATSLWGKE